VIVTGPRWTFDVKADRAWRIVIPKEQIDDLHLRLDNVRWPDAETVDDWSQGVPLSDLRNLAHYWRHSYDWRRCEDWLNAAGQHRARIDGLDIHFLHIRSHHDDALPLLLSHGWPGSVIEFRGVIDCLTNPELDGGDPKDAFHLVIPSLPGFGFSGKPTAPGWGTERIASAWEELMAQLGYDRFVAQGGDWGAAITTALGVRAHPALIGLHTNMPLVLTQDLPEKLSIEEAEMLADLQAYQEQEMGYSAQQTTRPQTLAYALADSPVGQAAWIYEKLKSWSDCEGDPSKVFSLDAMLDNIMMYWLTNSAASSARLYWESFTDGFGARKIGLPVGCSIFPKELYRAPRSWADACMSNLVHWNILDKGGHFAAFEQPAIFTAEMRNCFRSMR